MDIIDAFLKLAAEELDLLLIVSVVVFVQVLKAVFRKVPKKAWMLANFVFGFAAAWLVGPFPDFRAYAKEGISYAAGAELVYQGWRTIKDVVLARLRGGK